MAEDTFEQTAVVIDHTLYDEAEGLGRSGNAKGDAIGVVVREDLDPALIPGLQHALKGLSDNIPDSYYPRYSDSRIDEAWNYSRFVDDNITGWGVEGDDYVYYKPKMDNVFVREIGPDTGNKDRSPAYFGGEIETDTGENIRYYQEGNYFFVSSSQGDDYSQFKFTLDENNQVNTVTSAKYKTENGRMSYFEYDNSLAVSNGDQATYSKYHHETGQLESLTFGSNGEPLNAGDVAFDQDKPIVVLSRDSGTNEFVLTRNALAEISNGIRVVYDAEGKFSRVETERNGLGQAWHGETYKPAADADGKPYTAKKLGLPESFADIGVDLTLNFEPMKQEASAFAATVMPKIMNDAGYKRAIEEIKANSPDFVNEATNGIDDVTLPKELVARLEKASAAQK